MAPVLAGSPRLAASPGAGDRRRTGAEIRGNVILGLTVTDGEGIIKVSREPNWTAQEFETLLHGGHRAVEELAKDLRGRTVGAIEVVQQGIHNYHVGRGTAILTEMMLRRLGDRSRPVICPVCGMAAND